MRFSFTAFLAALPALALAAPLNPLPRGMTAIPGKYIAVLKPESSDEVHTSSVEALSTIIGAAPDAQLNLGTFKGFSFGANEQQLEQVKNMPNVAYVEPDMEMHASVTQSPATWGLGRISHKSTSNSQYNTYIYDASAGQNTFSYIIDTGIYTQHPDFGGRASFGANFAGDGSNNDGNGHGTHVAGTTGSNTYGVSKKTSLIAVKVLNAQGSGSNTGVIQGIQWAANDVKNKGRAGKAVANMSLGGGFSQATNDAVKAATQAGLFMAVAAGNDGKDARSTSPASEPSACTVGATDKNNAMAYFSNYGPIVDIFGPGVDITSTWNDGGIKTISGTSMATPHITGLGAYLLALEGSMSPAALCSRIQALANNNQISSLGSGSPNKIAYNGNGA